MKSVILVSFLAALAHIGVSPVSGAGANSDEPGTQGQHYEYNCAGDPMGCQNMCYYYYCLGRSNYLTYGGDGKIGQKIKRQNRADSGYRHKIFNLARRAVLGTTVQGAAYTTPDEYPPAAAEEGGSGSSLIGHDQAYKVQGARMKRMWGVLGTNQAWIEPYNWDRYGSPACNCKPNWPEHTYTNLWGADCDCDNDDKKQYIYHMTKDARRFKDAEFENWEPNANWGTSKWNFQGHSNMKREVLWNDTNVEVGEEKAKAKTGR